VAHPQPAHRLDSLEAARAVAVEEVGEEVEGNVEEVLRNLADEAWGALGWLDGTVQLSSRARNYKIAKLRIALMEADDYLAGKEPSENDGGEVILAEGER
jgi:hypothetical protein